MRTAEIEALFEAPPPRWDPRRLVMALLALVVVAGIVMIAVVSRNRSDALAELRVRADRVSVLREARGVIDPGEGEDLRATDIVVTDDTGRAQVDLFDGSLVRLDSSSELSLLELVDGDRGGQVGLALKSGRSWNRVAEREAGSFSVDIGEAKVNVVGTTFLVDCRLDPMCYVVGIDGEAEVESKAGPKMDVSNGDCVSVDGAGALESCDERKLGLIDAWVNENLAEDEQLAIEQVKVKPSTTPTATAPSFRRTFAPAPPGPRAATATPAPTDEPKETPEPTTRPKRTKSPPTPGPTVPPTAVPTPFDSPAPSDPATSSP